MDLNVKPGDVIKVKKERAVKGGVPGGVYTVEINGHEVTLYMCKISTPTQVSFDGKLVTVTDAGKKAGAGSSFYLPKSTPATPRISSTPRKPSFTTPSGLDQPIVGLSKSHLAHPRALKDDETIFLRTEIQNLRQELEALDSYLELVRKYFCTATEQTLDRQTLDLIKPKTISNEEKLFEKMVADPFTRSGGAGKVWAENVSVSGSVTVFFQSQDNLLAPKPKPTSKEVALEAPRKPDLHAMLFPTFNLNAVKSEHLELLGSSFFNVLQVAEEFNSDENDPQSCEHYLWLVVMHMFHNLDLIREFKIPEANLYRFIATICRRYRHVPFHNWFHAFNVTQTMYYFLTTLNCKHVLGKLEIFAMLIACLCHDADHPGLNNMFQAKAQTKVAELHKKSTLENHHLLQAMSVLSLPECDVLEGLDDEQVGILQHYIRDLILATDLSLHEMLKKDLNSRKKRIAKAFQNPKPSPLPATEMTSFICCVMKGSDLSNEIRPKHISNKWATRINKEFFAQVKTEKELSLPVTGFMDPTKIVVAKEQINFINNLCLPLYKALVGVNPGMQPCIDQMNSNLQEWQHRLGTWCEFKQETSCWQETQEVYRDKKSLSDALGGRSNVPAPTVRRRTQMATLAEEGKTPPK